MNKKYIFFIDIDGTLVKRGTNEINIEVADEIKKLKKQGHIFVISTGRALKNTMIIKNIEVFNYISVMFGTAIYELPKIKQLTKSETLDKDVINNLIKYFSEHNINWAYKDDTNEKTLSSEEKFLNILSHYVKVNNKELKNDIDNNKIIQFLCEGYLPKNDTLNFPTLDFFKMPGNYTDIIKMGCDKSKCIEFFKKLYPSHITVSIGDSCNDYAMFEKTEISIAMGNADDEAKQKATYVTKNVEENGIVYAFKEILKI